MAGAGHWGAVRVWNAGVFGLRSMAERLWWCGAGFWGAGALPGPGKPRPLP